MSFVWLKHFMPRGLYGRAALILVLPVIVLQLVISVGFIDRYFEDVTHQMTAIVTRELELVFEIVENAPDQENALAAIGTTSETLDLTVKFVAAAAVPVENSRRWFDLSGRYVNQAFAKKMPRVNRVMLPDNREITIYSPTSLGMVSVKFDRRRVSATNPHQLLVSTVFFGGLMTVIAYFYLRNQLRPIKRLAYAAEAFGRGRHIPYTPAGALEVRAAGSAFIDMRARIERQIEQRTMMLSGVSHDLRTPLTRLKLGLSMLESEDAGALERDVEDMQRLLDEFLNFAKGASEGEPEPVDPVAVVTEIVSEYAGDGKNVTLSKVEGEGAISLRLIAIKRAVGNLIGNAVRYGEKAEVSVVLTKKSLRIRVEDDGPGIPVDLRGEAIKPFVRLDPARNQNKGSGVGLGLAIAADIARAHGGVLRLGESEHLGGLSADIVIAR